MIARYFFGFLGILFLIFLVVALGLFGLSVTAGKQQREFDLYNSAIKNGKFAIVRSTATGSSIFLGNADGNATLEVHSLNDLSSPFIIDQSRILFIESTKFPVPEFHIVEMQISKSEIKCNRIVTSNDYIGNPFVAAGKYSKGVLFFSGQYYPNATGNPVPQRQLSIYEDGQVTAFEGKTFSTIGRLAQIDEDRFLGVTFSIEQLRLEGEDGSSFIDLQDNSSLVEVHLSDGLIQAVPAKIGALKVTTVLTVASLQKLNTVVISSVDFPSGVGNQGKLTFVQNSNVTEARTVHLSSDWDFSEPFLSGDDNGEVTASFFATEKVSSEAKEKLFLMDYVRDEFTNKRLLKVDGASIFNMPFCSNN